MLREQLNAKFLKPTTMKIKRANWIHICLKIVTWIVILELKNTEAVTIQQNLFTNLNEMTFVDRALSECAIA